MAPQIVFAWAEAPGLNRSRGAGSRSWIAAKSYGWRTIWQVSSRVVTVVNDTTCLTSRARRP